MGACESGRRSVDGGKGATSCVTSVAGAASNSLLSWFREGTMKHCSGLTVTDLLMRDTDIYRMLQVQAQFNTQSATSMTATLCFLSTKAPCHWQVFGSTRFP